MDGIPVLISERRYHRAHWRHVVGLPAYISSLHQRFLNITGLLLNTAAPEFWVTAAYSVTTLCTYTVRDPRVSRFSSCSYGSFAGGACRNKLVAQFNIWISCCIHACVTSLPFISSSLWVSCRWYWLNQKGFLRAEKLIYQNEYERKSSPAQNCSRCGFPQPQAVSPSRETSPLTYKAGGSTITTPWHIHTSHLQGLLYHMFTVLSLWL